MEPLLIDGEIAVEQSSCIAGGFANLGVPGSVAEGDTNDGANQRSMSLYESMQDMLSAYLSEADRDAQRIWEIGLHFADVDYQMSDKVTGTEQRTK